MKPLLTSKVKADFEQYLDRLSEKVHTGKNDIYLDEVFDKLPLCAQFGIYQDYFREKYSLLIDTHSYFTIKGISQFQGVIKKFDIYEPILLYFGEDRDEARKSCIEKAVEIVEQKDCEL